MLSGFGVYGFPMFKALQLPNGDFLMLGFLA